jgi:hypothetical protein
MMSPQLAAGITAFAGVCLVAGWISAFRNRAYVGWLGLAFLALSGSLWCAGAAREAQELGASAPPHLSLLAKLLVAGSVASFLIALAAAVQETRRRLREMREAHEASVEAMLAMMRAQRQREERDETQGRQDADPGGDER